MEMKVTRKRRKSTYLGSIIICLEEELFVTVGRLIKLLGSVGVTIHASQNLVGSDDCCSGFRLVDLLVTCHGDRRFNAQRGGVERLKEGKVEDETGKRSQVDSHTQGCEAAFTCHRLADSPKQSKSRPRFLTKGKRN
jgi:hypothetical protein